MYKYLFVPTFHSFKVGSEFGSSWKTIPSPKLIRILTPAFDVKNKWQTYIVLVQRDSDSQGRQIVLLEIGEVRDERDAYCPGCALSNPGGVGIPASPQLRGFYQKHLGPPWQGYIFYQDLGYFVPIERFYHIIEWTLVHAWPHPFYAFGTF